MSSEIVKGNVVIPFLKEPVPLRTGVYTLFGHLCVHSAFGPRFSGDDYCGNGNVATLRTTDINMDGRINYSSMPLARLDLNRFNQHILKPCDLVITRSGRVGTCAIFSGYKLPVIPGAFLIRFRLDQTRANPRFYSYFFNSKAGQDLLTSVATGSVQQNLNIPAIHNIVVPCPPLSLQNTIVDILAAFDDKIDSNRRMNETLEAMARALFKSWFVDFDPIRAKLDGRQPPGLDSATAALFPDRFQDSPVGQIPEGWEVGSILKQANLLSGGTPKTAVSAYWNGNVQWASAKDVSQCSDSFLISTERTITERGLKESSTKIIPRFSTVIVARGATTGRLTMLGSPMAMNQTCYALESKFSAPFTLYCHSRSFIDTLVHSAHGSIFDTITTQTFEKAELCLPPPDIQREFDKRVAPFFTRILTTLIESKALTSSRDILLPKLLGETLL